MLGKGVGLLPFFSISGKLSTSLDSRLQNRYPRFFKGGTGEKRAGFIKKEVDELDRYWNELIYAVCDGKASEMNELKRFDVFEFFDYIDNKSKKNGS